MKTVPHNLPCRHRGYTLLELLTAFCIVGIVLAVLIPVIARSRESGRKSVCSGHLRQLGTAFAQYVSDYDGRYPDYLDYGTSQGVPASWDVVIGVFAASPAILECPSDTTSARFDFNGGRQGAYRSYAYAYNVAKAGDAFSNDTTHETQVASPALTVLLAERTAESDDAAAWNRGQFTSDLGQSVAWRHNGAANFLFGDGHVKSSRGSFDTPPRFAGYPFDDTGSLCGEAVPLPN